MTEQPTQALAVIEKSNEIRLAAQLPAQFWPDERIKAIAKTVAPPGTGVPELALFLSVAHKYDLDPFVGEIWLVWDEKRQKFLVMTGRDAYIKTAMKDPDYEGINSGVVYEKDTFKQTKSEKGKVEILHEVHSMSARGRIVGAYCVAYQKKRLPVAVVRTWDHYKKLHNKSNWQSNPDDMIETRVIVAALRRQYNISGIYTEAEFAGIDEGDGALQDLKANENALRATEERVAELRAQLAEVEDRVEVPVVEVVEEDEPTAWEVVDVQTGEILEEDPVFPLQEHGPMTADLDAYIVEEDQTPVEEASPEEAAEIRKKQIRYMALWNEKVGADRDFRHRWQKASIRKESTKDWTLHDFDDAIELLESDEWTAFLAPPGQDSIQGELGT